MIPTRRIAFFMVTAALSVPVFAQDQAAPAQPVPAETAAAPAADAPAPAPAPKKAKSAMNSAVYKKCLSQKLAVADTFCSANASGCDAEKAGAKTECSGEAKGVKHTG